MARSPSKYMPGHGTPSTQRRSWLDHAAKAEARTVISSMKRGREPRAADRRKNRKSWKAQAKILKRAGRSRRRRRRIMSAGYQMKQEARSAAAGLRGAHGSLGRAYLAKMTAPRELTPEDEAKLADLLDDKPAPAVPTLSAAEAFAVHEAEHSGPMEACSHQLCQWATLLGAP